MCFNIQLKICQAKYLSLCHKIVELDSSTCCNRSKIFFPWAKCSRACRLSLHRSGEGSPAFEARLSSTSNEKVVLSTPRVALHCAACSPGSCRGPNLQLNAAGRLAKGWFRGTGFAFRGFAEIHSALTAHNLPTSQSFGEGRKQPGWPRSRLLVLCHHPTLRDALRRSSKLSSICVRTSLEMPGGRALGWR